MYKRRYSIPLKKKQKKNNVYEPDEEARLERIVFGDPSDIINNLLSDKSIIKEDKFVNNRNKEVLNDKQNKAEHVDLVNDLSIEDISAKEKKAAWTDEDDYNYTTNSAPNVHIRKSCNRPEIMYTTYLENRYKLFVGTPEWAKIEKIKKVSSDSDNEILKHSCHLEAPEIGNLPKNIIDIKALTALNKSTHTEGPIVTSVEFHPSSTVALVAGTSGALSLFQVDGHTNNKLHSMLFKKFPISKATFMKEGAEILLGSQYHPYCHTYDLMNGKTHKLFLPRTITNMKCYQVSPNGKLIAVCGKIGEIYLLHSSTKELISTFNMNSKCRTLAFTPDNKMLISHGDCSEIYVWDLNTRTCIHRAIDDGCLSCTSLAISSNGQFIASGSAQGVVNVYDMKTVLEEQSPMPLKIMMNLVTGITNLKFNPTSEILSIASDKKHNAFKMMHLPSFTVFSNFPTFQTNIGMPQTINFSPGSGYFAISNRTHSALLYRLKHYGNY